MILYNKFMIKAAIAITTTLALGSCIKSRDGVFNSTWLQAADADCSIMCLEEKFPDYEAKYFLGEIHCFCKTKDTATLIKKFKSNDY